MINSAEKISYPSQEVVNQNRLLDACVDAVAEYGLQALQMNHIIEKSGLSRRTVYKYYGNKAEIINSAYIRESVRLLERSLERISSCDSLEDIFVFGFMYAYEELPKHPLLRELIHHNREILTYLDVDMSLEDMLIEHYLTQLFQPFPEILRDIKPLMEYWSHALLSFLLLPVNRGRTLAEVEVYVRKRFVPGLGLEKYLSK